MTKKQVWYIIAITSIKMPNYLLVQFKRKTFFPSIPFFGKKNMLRMLCYVQENWERKKSRHHNPIIPQLCHSFFASYTYASHSTIQKFVILNQGVSMATKLEFEIVRKFKIKIIKANWIHLICGPLENSSISKYPSQSGHPWYLKIQEQKKGKKRGIEMKKKGKRILKIDHWQQENESIKLFHFSIISFLWCFFSERKWTILNHPGVLNVNCEYK